MKFSYAYNFLKYGNDSFGISYESNGYYAIINEVLIVIDCPIYKYSFINETNLLLINPYKQSKAFVKLSNN